MYYCQPTIKLLFQKSLLFQHLQEFLREKFVGCPCVTDICKYLRQCFFFVLGNEVFVKIAVFFFPVQCVNFVGSKAGISFVVNDGFQWQRGGQVADARRSRKSQGAAETELEA